MEFTYNSYIQMISLLRESGYCISDYDNWKSVKHPVILRHDIDTSIESALQMAEIEAENNIQSTYFVLLSSDLYNVLSANNAKKIFEIRKLGHEVGLHFDEAQYPSDYGNVDAIKRDIIGEIKLISDIMGDSISKFSYHRPSKEILAANISIPGVINSYGDVFFQEFKYLSDSRHRWREPVEEIIEEKKFDKLHILTHAFWYENENVGIQERIYSFINHANVERYMIMKENISDIDSIIKYSDVVK